MSSKQLAVAILTAIASEGVLYGPFLALALVSFYLQSSNSRRDERDVSASNQKSTSLAAITGLNSREHFSATIWFTIILTNYWILHCLPLSSEAHVFDEEEQDLLRTAGQIFLLLASFSSDMILTLRVWRLYRGTFWPRLRAGLFMTCVLAVCSGALRQWILSNHREEDAWKIALWFQGVQGFSLYNKLHSGFMITLHLRGMKFTSRTDGPNSELKRHQLNNTFLFLQNGFILILWESLTRLYYGRSDPVLSFPIMFNPMVAGISFVLTTISGIYAFDMHRDMPFIEDISCTVSEEKEKDPQTSADIEAQQ